MSYLSTVLEKLAKYFGAANFRMPDRFMYSSVP